MQISINQIKQQDKVIIAFRENDIFAYNCAYICWRFFIKERNFLNVRFMSLTYDDPIPNVTGAYLFLCGMSYKEEVMLHLAKEFKYCWGFDAYKTTTEDYHKTNYIVEHNLDNIALYLKSDNPVIYPDNQIVRNVWSVLYPGVNIPGVLDLVPYTPSHESHMAQANMINFLRARRFNFEKMHRYAIDLDELYCVIAESDNVRDTFTQICGNVANAGLQFGELDGVMAAVVNAPDVLLEPVINIILNTKIVSGGSQLGAGLVVGYSVSARHINYTLVSCTENTDVSAMARKYGGYGDAEKAFISRPLNEPIPLGSRTNSSMIH